MFVIEFILNGTLVAFVAAFVLLLAKKIGVIEQIQVRAKSNILQELSRCDFCLSFWTCLFVSLIFAISADWTNIFLPLFSTAITRKMQ